MAALVISAAGAALGSLIPGVGTAIGWAAGSLISSIFAPDQGQHGPRLADTKVQVSSYGVALPIPYGGVRIAGNIIWATDLVEHEHDAGGKGGPNVTTYSYTVSCAIAFGEGPIGGIRRIWADAKLVYDISPTADAATQAASASFAQYLTVHLGTESQMPDATIEAAEGAGNVEPYRGTAYMVLTDVPLADYGNRIPNWTVETTTEVTEEPPLRQPKVLLPWEYSDIDNGTGVVTARDYPLHGRHGEPMEFTVLKPGGVAGTFSTMAAAMAAAVAKAAEPDSLFGGSDPYIAGQEFIGISTSSNSLASPFTGGADVADDPRTVTYYFGIVGINALDSIDNTPTDPYPSALLCPATDDLGTHVARYDFSATYSGVRQLRLGGATDPSFPILLNYCSNLPGSPGIVSAPFTVIQGVRLVTCRSVTCDVGDPCASADGAQVPGQPTACISCAGDVSFNAEYVNASGNHRVLLPGPVYSGGNLTLVRNAVGPVLASTDPNYSDEQWWRDAAAADGIDLTGLIFGSTFGVVVSSACTAPGPASAPEGSVFLSDIVTDICARAGLTAIDVSELTDVVQGFKVARQMSARAALEPLRTAYFFDAVENGDTVQFVKRGGASVATIGPDELGAGEGDPGAVLVDSRRAQETELPSRLEVAYECRAADYQTGTQKALRTTTGSQQLVGVELPIVLTDEKAAQVADVALVDAWVGRTERRFTTTRRYTHLLPTDVVAVDDGEFEYEGRITSKLENGPVIEWTLRDQAAATYDPNAAFSVTSGGGSRVRFDGPMRVELMDLPLLLDADDNAGFYAAARGYRASFHGGVLYRSPDGSAYTDLKAMAVQATMGNATTALGDFEGGNLVDELNSVTVSVNGALASITRTQLLDGGNVAALGDEVLQFQRATLIAPGTYTLTGLLRGRKGSEEHIPTHAIGDRFVLLTQSTVYRIEQQVAQVGLAYYKGVSYGTSVADVPAQAFDNTAEGLLPRSPVHLNVAPVPGGGYAATWVRRSRLGADWQDSVDAPLGEASESYLVQVFDGATLIETLTVDTPAATLGNPAAGLGLTQVLEYSAAAFALVEIGAETFGFLVSDLPGSSKRVASFDAAGVKTAQSPVLGHQMVQLAASGTNLYALTYRETTGTPAAYVDSTVSRLAVADITTVAATYTSAIPGDFRGLAWDGTNVWVAEKSTGLLHKLNPTTLAMLSTHSVDVGIQSLWHDAGKLWILREDGLDTEVICWDIAGTSVDHSFVFDGEAATDVRVVGDLVFVAGADTVGVFDSAASDDELYRHPRSASWNQADKSLAEWGDYIVASSYPGVMIIDKATGALADDEILVAMGVTYIAGVVGDELLLSGSPNDNYLNMRTRSYTLAGAVSASDYSGFTVSVRQVSQTIGAGHAAVATIP